MNLLHRPILATGAVVSLVVTATVIVLALGTVGVALVGILLLGVILHLLPIRILPAVALWSYIALPLAFTPLGGPLAYYFTPAVIVLAIWSFRAMSLQGSRKSGSRMYIVIFVMGAVALLVGAATGVNPVQSFSWLAVYVVTFGLVVPAALKEGAIDIRALERALLWAGILLGSVAVGEYVLGANPWNLIYSDETVAREWSVFRARSTMGHPLQLALAASGIFGAALVLLRRHRALAIAALILSALAVMLSASLTGVVAMGAALAATTLRRTQAGESRRRGAVAVSTVVIGCALLVVTLSSDLLETRSAAEGSGSWGYRAVLLDMTVPLFLERPFFGSGAGTSSVIFEQVGIGLPLENSALQLLLSTGLSGLAVLISLAWASARAIRYGSSVALTGIAAVVVSLVGFNGLDATPGVLAFLGIFVVMAWHSSTQQVDVSRGKVEPLHKAYSGTEHR